tara:strand:- start:232 stop:633 length:402 start_codon:yes stop_codon:yes gene_type:complete
MSKSISPKLTITANTSTASTNPGPSTVALNLSAKPTNGLATVTAFETKIVITTTSHVEFHDASEIGECYLYLKNSSDTEIWVGDGAGDMSGGSNRYMTLAAGDFVFVPWSNDKDLYVDCSAADKTLEYFAFKK